MKKITMEKAKKFAKEVLGVSSDSVILNDDELNNDADDTYVAVVSDQMQYEFWLDKTGNIYTQLIFKNQCMDSFYNDFDSFEKIAVYKDL